MRVRTSGPELITAAGTVDRQGQCQEAMVAQAPLWGGPLCVPPSPRGEAKAHIQTQSVLLGVTQPNGQPQGLGAPRGGDSTRTPQHPWGHWHEGVGALTGVWGCFCGWGAP